MAVLADVGHLDVIEGLARCADAVVAARAIAGYPDMIESRRPPCDRRVAVVAIVAALDVRGMLANRGDAVMAGATEADDLQVIDGKCRQPGIRRVAVLADVARVDVRRWFAGSVDTVMAVDAGAGDADVLEVRGQPARRRVTVVAVVAAVDMPDVLARCSEAIVTGSADSEYLEVIHGLDRRPGIRAVTVRTDLGRL